MPLKNYGILKGQAISSKSGFGSSPHYQIHMKGGSTDFRIAINVKSSLSPSELLYLIDDNFQHPILDKLTTLEPGFTEIKSETGGAAMDYVRGNLFDKSKLRPLPHKIPGPDNDLNEKIGAFVQRAVGNPGVDIYAFGERWGPESSNPDKYFGFLPGNGIHDIHMNQGNVGRFEKDDGVWQDGGLLFHFHAIGKGGKEIWPEQWVAVFLAFQSQSFLTDDETGHKRTPDDRDDEETPPASDGDVRILAALVNPKGHDVGDESVTLFNVTNKAIDLSGWEIADRNDRREKLKKIVIPSGETEKIVLSGNGAQLGNKGGIITLLDAQGLKVDGVSYIKSQVSRQGWSIVF